MWRDAAFRSGDDTDGQARLRADLHALAAANTSVLDNGSIEGRKLEGYGALAERAHHDAGAADAAVDPRIARVAIDLGDAHVDLGERNHAERVAGADLHAFAAQRAGFGPGIDVWRVGGIAAVALIKPNATGRTYFTAKSAADARCREGRIVGERARRFEPRGRSGRCLRRQQPG